MRKRIMLIMMTNPLKADSLFISPDDASEAVAEKRKFVIAYSTIDVITPTIGSNIKIIGNFNPCLDVRDFFAAALCEAALDLVVIFVVAIYLLGLIVSKRDHIIAVSF